MVTPIKCSAGGNNIDNKCFIFVLCFYPPIRVSPYIIGQAASSQPTDSFLLSRYHFRILDSFGWNFRHAHFHEEGRRTLYKAFGIKFVIIVQGRAGEKIIFVVNGPSGHCSQFKLHSPPEIQQSSLLPLLMICRKQNEQPVMHMQGQAWTLKLWLFFLDWG